MNGPTPDAGEGGRGASGARAGSPDDAARPWPERDHEALAAELGAARAATEAAALERLARLLGVVWRLRDPDGCPWDREQSVESMAPNLVEEAYEAVEAIASGDDRHVAEELGDVLMNVLLTARIGEQDGRFDLTEVATGIATKLVRRHPHVFGPRDAADADEALVSWNESKAREKAERAGDGEPPSVLDDVPSGLPGLTAARKLGKRAARVGFDWPDARGALEKLREEVGELDDAAAALAGASGTAAGSATGAASETAAETGAATGAADAARRRVEDELGDVLFSAVNVARKAGVDPELALRRTLEKFRRRFAAVERALAGRLRAPDGAPPADAATLEEMEAAWRAARDAEDP